MCIIRDSDLRDSVSGSLFRGKLGSRAFHQALITKCVPVRPNGSALVFRTSWLSPHRLDFEILWAKIAQVGVASPAIVESLDIVEHIRFGLLS